MSMLYIVLITIVVIACSFGISYLMKKCNLKDSDVQQGIVTTEAILQLITASAKEMKLGTEDEIEQISQIVLKVLDGISELSSTSDMKENILKATVVAIAMCKETNIKVDNTKALLISNLITIAYNSKFNPQK
jgi:hypothetical protein